jgi:hypothetical protein
MFKLEGTGHLPRGEYIGAVRAIATAGPWGPLIDSIPRDIRSAVDSWSSVSQRLPYKRAYSRQLRNGNYK